MAEVEEAMAEARLQQKEAEVEHKKQGITINLWDTFQSELFSIISCSTNDCAAKTTALEVNKTKLSFDGGGSCKKTDFTTNFCDNSDNWPSKIIDNRSVENSKAKEFSSAPKRKLKQALKFQSPRLKLCKLQCSSGSNKSLQSQAAKRLLEKAKMANLLESNKNTSAEKKFILPSHSIHSSRVIKPNKRFLEENMSKRKFVEGHSELCKKLKFTNSVEDVTLKTSIDKKLPEEIKEDITNGDSNKKSIKKDGSFETKPNEMKNSIESSKNSLVNSSTGKIILREARLQLDNSNISLLEGPFSTPSASSLSPNSQLSMNPMQSVTAPGNIVCGVCGIVRFYKFVELARKFGIYCCEFCQKFISKIIKSFEIRRDLKLQCLKGNGLCGMNLSGKTQDFNNIRPINNSKCQACWLKLCLKNFQMPINLKEKLIKVLPMNMQISINLEYHSKSSEITNSFKLSNHNIKDFKWYVELN